MSQSSAWVVSREAVKILSETNGRAIDPHYLYVLASRQRIRSQLLPGFTRVRVYNRKDCERYRLRTPKEGAQ